MTDKTTQLYQVIEQAITNPSIPHEPYKQSLKNWAMYCLRDRGFIVVYAQNADFAIQLKGGEKIYFKVSNTDHELDGAMNWIVWNSTTKTASLVLKK
ncbi:MAG TPA: hypothetical protein VK184_01015 [Nostocaceae cyanobacterium]|nr:hypothetical protein [Nostocaceae cyanobacterium]